MGCLTALAVVRQALEELFDEIAVFLRGFRAAGLKDGLTLTGGQAQQGTVAIRVSQVTIATTGTAPVANLSVTLRAGLTFAGLLPRLLAGLLPRLLPLSGLLTGLLARLLSGLLTGLLALLSQAQSRRGLSEGLLGLLRGLLRRHCLVRQRFRYGIG